MSKALVMPRMDIQAIYYHLDQNVEPPFSTIHGRSRLKHVFRFLGTGNQYPLS